MVKSFRKTGIETAPAISLKYSSLPINHFGSVRHDIAAAPAASYSLAISRYGKSSAITPFDGDAFLTSQINEIPSAASAFSNSNPPFVIASARTLTSDSGVCEIIFSYLSAVCCAIVFKIVAIKITAVYCSFVVLIKPLRTSIPLPDAITLCASLTASWSEIPSRST